MDKKILERRLQEYADGACVMTTKQFGKFYGINAAKASIKLKNAGVEKVSSRWFIPSIVDKVYQNIL